MGCCGSKSPTTTSPPHAPAPLQPPPSQTPPPSQPLKSQTPQPLPSQAPQPLSSQAPQRLSLPQHPPSPPPPPPPPTPTQEMCISLFKKINNVGDIDYLIDIIDKLLETLPNKSKEDRTLNRSISSESVSDTVKGTSTSVWTSFLQSGAAFLEFVNKHIQQEKRDGGTREAVAQILQNVGRVHWVVGGLSVVAFVLDQIGQVSDNLSECIELLSQMVELAEHIRQLNYEWPQEEKKLSEAIQLIVEGSMMCASQLNSKKLFRFLKASVDSKSLSSLRLRINQVYEDLTLRVVIETHHLQPISFSSLKPTYPDYAVGIEEQKTKVAKLLDMETKYRSSLAVVIYGFGGIGKTTLANAVIADLNLNEYNYTGFQIYEDSSRNDIKTIQQQILKDAFPAYSYDRNATLRNSTEGRNHLTNAFKAEGNKPVFIFIDNALRKEDLQEISPKSLASLPKSSRIVVTTRKLGVTDMLKQDGLQRREHRVDTLPEKEAIEILFKDHNHDEKNYRDGDSMHKTLQICDGIPLVLEIVGARLRKQNYMPEKCTQIFEALKQGKDIKEENLSKRLVNFVYNELEASTQEAFLDICCFFANWNRHDVEDIVGAEDVTLLEEAALLKTSEKEKVIVHDIIRAKALSICESNRIRKMQSWLDTTQDNQRLSQIKGLWLTRDDSGSGSELQEHHLNSAKGLLRVLALGSQIQISPTPNISNFKELRFLRLDGDISGLQKFPERLDHLSRLKVLILDEWDKMQELPDQVCGLCSLLKSSICGGNSLKSLPALIGQLSSLQELNLTSCKQLEQLPERFGELNSLKVLNLAECVNFRELPLSFWKLSSLEVLNLESCWKLEALPSSFEQLGHLKKLSLQSDELKELPGNIGELRSLTEMRCNCVELKELPSSIDQLVSLTHLDLSCCMKLKRLPSSVTKLSSLEDFNLLACNKLEELPSNIGALPRLKQLDLRKCRSLTKCPTSALKQMKQGLTVWLPDHLRDKDSTSCNEKTT